MKALLDKIEKITRNCGKIIIECDYNCLEIEQKDGNNNIVTKYDKLIQETLKKELLNLIPNANFIGEENDFVDTDNNNKYTFIVDPIDGTTNFSRNIKMCAISVALLENQEPIIGVCYNPYLNEMYKAIKGKGAYLNNQSIHVSNKKLKEGIVLCGSAPYYNNLREESLKIQKTLSLMACDYRRMGSAVIELCNIASGKAEVYFELNLMPWDYAAASLILKEAGGRITTIDGKKIQYDNDSSILASNGVEEYLNYLEYKN